MAPPHTPEEEASLSEIIDSFNQRHGTEFTEADLLRLEQVKDDILNDDLIEMMRNNPSEDVYKVFGELFLKRTVNHFRRDSELKSVILTGAQARELAIRHFFNRALRSVQT